MPLNEIIEILINSETKKAAKLSRGLYLAFTPQPAGDTNVRARLVWSRWGKIPTLMEDEVVREAVERAFLLIPDRVVIDGPFYRHGVPIKSGWGSSLLTWRWVGTAELLNLSKTDQYRAGQWLRKRKAKRKGKNESIKRNPSFY